MRWRVVAAALLAALLSLAPSARADVDDYIGRRVAAISFEADGRPVSDPRFTALVATRVGDVLTMAAVRESMTHLFSLGTFADVRVVADRRGDDVVLTFELHALR